MKTLLILVALTLAPLRAFAVCDGWTSTHTTLESAVLAVHYLDYRQTSEIVSQPERWQEANPFMLTPRPSQHAVDNFFLATTIFHIIGACALPPPERTTFQLVTFAFNLGVTASNAALGIDVRF